MEHINKIMVGIDLTEMDDYLIKYTAFIAKTLKAQEVFFVHVLGEEEDLELYIPFDGTIQEYVEAKKGNVFANTGVQRTEVKVLMGNPLKSLIKFTQEESIDLAIVGLKNREKGAGVLPQRFTRSSPCSVLFVPSNADLKLNKILLPTDFSEYSKMAFEEVAIFKRNNSEAQILAQHVYKVPTGYYKTGKTYEEFAEIMAKNAGKRYRKYLEEIGIAGLEPELELSLHNGSTTTELINEYAHAQRVDLIIIGAKGHTGTSAFLLGSKTEKLLGNNKDIPLLVLKKKGETLGFLETMKFI